MTQASPKIAIVIQRYGASIIGGAETHARLVAQRLQAQAGYQVEIYTTTSVDYRQWDDTLAPGTHTEDGLTVHRFRPLRTRGRWTKVWAGLLRLGRLSRALPAWRRWLEHRWIRSQGPWVPSLIETLIVRQAEYRAVIFFTYLYYPTLVGLPQITRPKILVPTAHDEWPFYLTQVGHMLACADRILANTPAEAHLIQRVHGPLPHQVQVVGIGLEPPPEVRILSLTSGAPLRILYMGRVGPAKGVDELIDSFKKILSQSCDLAATLHIAGPLEEGFRVPSDHPGIEYLGVVSEAQKADELLKADIVINPSHHESLSLLVLEGILAHKLVLVQKSCEVLRDYAQKYPLVWDYGTTEDLAEALKRARERISNPVSIETALKEQASSVAKSYSWDLVIAVFQQLISGIDLN